MKTKTLYTFSEQIIIENINFDGYEVKCDNSLFSKINNVYNIFVSEYGHEIKRRGEINAFKEWLQGLPTVLTVPFYNYDILNRMYAHGIIQANASEVVEERQLNDYWINLAKAFFTLKNNL